MKKKKAAYQRELFSGEILQIVFFPPQTPLKRNAF
jgi:hypothetical protein